MELWYTEQHTETAHFSIKIKNHVYSEKSKFQTLDIFDTYEFGRLFTLDGLIMLTQKDEFIYHDMIVHVPMAVNPDIKKVLVIGGGDGGTVRELTRYETIEKIDMVEIDKKVVDVSKKYLPFTASKLSDHRVTLYFEDGIDFVVQCTDQYDLILVDSTDPIGPGEGLFKFEFYTNCKRILKENGILINQHESPYYTSYANQMKKAHAKLNNIFPISRVYQAHIPTYPSGHWLFGFASKNLDPIKDAQLERWLDFGINTKYYNTELHKGCFALPSYVIELLESVYD